jgi:glycosyltransferase involved in cell wall biosynthesis
MAPPAGPFVGPILMICPQFRPIVGGYERAAERLSRELARRGVAVTVVTFRSERDWPEREVFDGVEIIRLPYRHRRGLTSLTASFSLLWFLLRRGSHYAIWHAHAPNPEVAFAFLIGKFKRIPTVLKLPSSGTGGIARAARQGVFGKLGFVRSGLRLASAALATSQTMESEVEAFFPEQTIKVTIPNGVDTEEFRARTRTCDPSARAYWPMEKGSVAISVGRLSHEKNPVLLIDAWAKLPAIVRHKAHLVFIGDGPMKDVIERRAEALGIASTVSLQRSTDKVSDFYNVADLFVLPSDREGLSNAMLEAMSSGLPIVMTAVGGFEWVSEAPPCGIVVPVGDAEALSKAIGALLADPGLRKRFGQNARDRIISKASIQMVADRTMVLYEALENISYRRR